MITVVILILGGIRVTDLIRRALLGDESAQEECTEKGILLPCPFCGSKSVSFECQDSTWRGRHGVMCTNSLCIAYDITPQYGTAKSAIKDWNTRKTPPIWRCKVCSYKRRATVNNKGFLICPASGMEIDDDDFCSYFELDELNEMS